MQTFAAQLSKNIDPVAFRQAWDIDANLNGSPQTDFDFQSDGRVSVSIHSTPPATWDEANFKKAFTIALHRVDIQCQVIWT